MKMVRVSEGSRSAAHHGKKMGLSLGELRREWEILVVKKRDIEIAIAELKDNATRENLRIRREYGGDKTKSIDAWLKRKEEMAQERTDLIREKNVIESQFRDLKDLMRPLLGEDPEQCLSEVQIKQYMEGLRTIIRSELGEVFDFLRLRTEHQKDVARLARVDKKYEGVAEDPHALLRAASDLMQAMGDRLKWEDNVTDEERKLLRAIRSYLRMVTEPSQSEETP